MDSYILTYNSTRSDLADDLACIFYEQMELESNCSQFLSVVLNCKYVTQIVLLMLFPFVKNLVCFFCSEYLRLICRIHNPSFT